MDKYEISLWEDYPVTADGINYLDERKLCVIGSDTMTSQFRAFEPKLVTNVNGTSTFTFKMYSSYIDEITGEELKNPFMGLLINERKIKVLWKNEWYDLLIKNIEENSAEKSIVYTCKDSFITELSKNGYNLEYTTDLQNNTGTASELVATVLEGSGWQFDNEGSTNIIQKTEEPVYEVEIVNQFNAIKQSPQGDINVVIPQQANILIFYSQVVGLTQNQNVDIQFLYAAEGYATDKNDMLVINGDCYIANFDVEVSGTVIIIRQNGNYIVNFTSNTDISTRYRAERLVKKQLSEYDKLFDRYVNVYTDSQTSKKVYGYTKTEFSDPLAIINLIVNPNQFTSLDGWFGNELLWQVYPKFESGVDISDYAAKSYLKLTIGDNYNSALSANQAYLKPSQGDIKQGRVGGFHIGEKYVFRVKVHYDDAGHPDINEYVYDDSLTPIISEYEINNNGQYIISSNNYFNVSERSINGDWNEYILTCEIACPSEEIEKLGLFIHTTSIRWVEDIELFKLEYGITSYDNTTQLRINPGEISLQGIAKTIYRYYNADHDNVKSVEQLAFLYEGEEPQLQFIPVTNNYEKIATIEIKQSNRFNILQAIAENFECWVRFIINHDNTGKVLLDENGFPQKYVRLVEYIGNDLGLTFEYGIDVKNIKRTIVSDDLTTKVIVEPNENEFAQNGFCTISRSDLNYSKENFVLDFGYYINQGLLDQRTVDRDLYSTSENYLGYYYNLHKWNKEYDEITSILNQKQIEYTKQKSQLTVLEAQQKATIQQLENCQADIMTLACVDNWEDATSYAQSHADHVKVQSLMNSIAELNNTIQKNQMQLSNLNLSIQQLENYITSNIERQQNIINASKTLHENFFKKYARYIQEGTWQDESYIDDTQYYLDAVDVAYTSSRPQLQYDISVLRLSGLEEYSSKEFNVGDICYVIDRDFFGYAADGITPYKLKIIVSEITSNFNNPEQDVIKVQNYKTQFDDLFQRITATTQSLQYAQGGYEKAAGAINHDNTLSFDLLQDTFDYNENWVLNANNQQVTWDSTGITVIDDSNAALKLKIMAGGVFISNDGGVTWKNAVRGDGISTDVLTAGRINTSEIYVYDGNHPSFRWDSAGIDAYYYNDLESTPTFSKYVRFDRFGIYGYNGASDFVPSTEDLIWDPESGVKFGLTWRGFFLRGENENASLEISDDGQGIIFRLKSDTEVTKDQTEIPVSLEISTDKDIVLKTGNIDRIQIGRFIDNGIITDYGIWVRDENGNNIFNVSATGVDSIGGWNLTQDSFYHTVSNSGTIGLYSQGKTWTILNPNSTSSGIDPDTQKIGNAQAGTGRPSAGDVNSYYIIAGNRFGVTIDGEIFSAGGRIGGWYINEKSLFSNNSNTIMPLIAQTSGSGYVQPKYATNSLILQTLSGCYNAQYDVSNYHNKVLYLQCDRNYNITNYPVFIVAVNNNNEVLYTREEKNTSEFTEDSEYVIDIESNVKYIYINYSITCILRYKDEEESIVTLSNVSTSGYRYVIYNGQDTYEINSSISNSYYKQYNVSNYAGKILYLTSTRNYYSSHPILAVIVDENDKYIQSKSISSNVITEVPFSLPSSAAKLFLNYSNEPASIGYSTGRTVTINNDGSINCTNGSTGNLWKIDSQGNAYFEMINAVGGYIAGWHIDGDSIWNDNGTELSASNSAVYNTNRYTIVTNSIAASGGNIGGWNLSPSGFSAGSMGLNSSGIITLGGSQIYTYSTGTVGISPSLHVTGSITANQSILTLSSLRGKDLKLNSSATLTYTDINYLHWLDNNWGRTTPEQVREAGAKSVYANAWAISKGALYWGLDDRAYIDLTVTPNLKYTSLAGDEVDLPDTMTKVRQMDVYDIWKNGWDSKACPACDSCCPPSGYSRCYLYTDWGEYGGYYYLEVSTETDSLQFKSRSPISYN